MIRHRLTSGALLTLVTACLAISAAVVLVALPGVAFADAFPCEVSRTLLTVECVRAAI